MSATIDLLAVIVPARDEEACLPRCLDAIQRAADRLRGPVASDAPAIPVVRVIVVLDRCVDGSAVVASRFPSVETVTSEAGLVGAARALGVRHVLGTAQTPPDRIWIANTDADSVVPEDWLRVQLEAARAGVGALAGAVRPDEEGLSADQLRDYLLEHPLADDHRNVHGANLGMRADRYLTAGGFDALPSGEDVALVAALSASGAQLRFTAQAPVTTSSRLSGRAPGGYAHYLRGILTP